MDRQLSPARFEPDPEPLVRGSYMHEALEEVMGRLEGPVTAENLADALRILDDVVAEIPPTLARGAPRRCAPRRCARSRRTCAAT